MEVDSEIRSTTEWHFLSRYPPRYLARPFDIRLFRQWIVEWEAGSPGFASRLRIAALYALNSDDADEVRQGLQCLASVGIPEDCERLTLLRSADPNVTRDARTCAFEMKAGNRVSGSSQVD